MATRSPTLAALEDEVSRRPEDDEDRAWFAVLSQYEPVASRAEHLSEQDQRLLVRKFRLLYYFVKHMFAEFRLDDIAGYLIPPNGDIRSRVCLPLLKALISQAVRKGRRKVEFESIERPTHRVDSACWELRPKAMKDDEVDDVEMALRKAFTIVDGKTAEVQDIEQALRDLYELRTHDVLVKNPPPGEPEPQTQARSDTVSVACPNPECAARIRAPVKYAGRKARCPKCGQPFTVPSPSG